MAYKYTDFELIVDEGKEGYLLEARGPGVRVNSLPFDIDLQGALKEDLARVKLGFPPDRTRLENIGRALFTTLFPTEVFGGYLTAQTAQPDIVFRLKITIRVSTLNQLPWELLFDPFKKTFLAARTPCPIVRYTNSSNLIPLPPLGEQMLNPIRVLYLEANPAGTEPLNLKDSLATFHEALGNKGEVKCVTKTTFDELLEVLQEEEYHVLHYAGHAEFDEKQESGWLNLHQPDGTVAPLSYELLDMLLDLPSLRLVVLSACQTAAQGRQRRFSGIAQRLMATNNRLRAIVAMQYQMADRSAVNFSYGFYKALTTHAPVEAAVVEGRKRILLRSGVDDPFANVDWATPVLFMRDDDGFVLNVDQKETRMTNDQEEKNKQEVGDAEVGDGAVAIGPRSRVVGNRGVYIGRDAKGNNIITGDNNKQLGDISIDGNIGPGAVVDHKAKVRVDNIAGGNIVMTTNPKDIADAFAEIYAAIETKSFSSESAAQDVREAVEIIEEENDKGEQVNERVIRQSFRTLARMAPDIFDVAITTFTNPLLGISKVVKKISEKAEAEAKK